MKHRNPGCNGRRNGATPHPPPSRARPWTGAGVLAAAVLLAWCSQASASSLGIAVSQDPRVGVPAQVTLTGSPDAAGFLYVLIQRVDLPCATTHGRDGQYADQARYQARTVAAGFNESYAFTPAGTSGSTVCAYLSNTSYADDTDPSNDRAVASTGFTAREPQPPSLALVLGPIGRQGEPTSVTAAGTSEIPVQVAVFALDYEDPPCAGAEPDQALRGSIGHWTQDVQGGFAPSFSFTPAATGPHRVCGYITQTPTNSLTVQTLARIDSPFDVPPPAPPHLTVLHLGVSTKWGTSRRKPGRTEISIRSTPAAADVTLRIRRKHRVLRTVRFAKDQDPNIHFAPYDPLKDLIKASASTSSTSYIHRWSCDAGGPTTYELTATDAYGKTVVRRKTARLPSCRSVLARARRNTQTQSEAPSTAQPPSSAQPTCLLGDHSIFDRSNVSCRDAQIVLKEYFGGYLGGGWSCRKRSAASPAGDPAGNCERFGPVSRFYFT
jgi:hypothetical protein